MDTRVHTASKCDGEVIDKRYCDSLRFSGKKKARKGTTIRRKALANMMRRRDIKRSMRTKVAIPARKQKERKVSDSRLNERDRNKIHNY